MHGLVAWGLGIVGAACFAFGMAGMWSHLLTGRLPLVSGPGWGVPLLFLIAALAAWGGAALVWQVRPRPRAIPPRRRTVRGRPR